MPSQFEVADFKTTARVPERKAKRAGAGRPARAGWAHIANFWRLRVVGAIARLTKDEHSDEEANRPMQYQGSFYTLQ